MPLEGLERDLRPGGSSPPRQARYAGAPRPTAGRYQLSFREKSIPASVEQHDGQPLPPRFLADHPARRRCHRLRPGAGVELPGSVVLCAAPPPKTMEEAQAHPIEAPDCRAGTGAMV